MTETAAHDQVGEARLRRDLGVRLAVAVTVNAMVGTGIFRLSPRVQQLTGSSQAALVVWILGGVISLCGALCLSELAASMPRAGGIYEVLRRAYGPRLAFVYGFTRLTLLGPSAAGGFSRLAAESLAAAFAWGADGARDTLIAGAVLLVCTLSNLSGVRSASTGQAILTVVKYAGLVLLGLACILASTPNVSATTDLTVRSSPSWTTAFAALVSVMWAYDGWGDMSSLAGETRDPGRTLPRALGIGTLVVIFSYVLVNLGYTAALGEQGVLASTSGTDMVAMNAARASLGDVGARLLAGLVFVSCLGACMVGVLTGSRVFVAMAADGLFIRALGRVSETGTPARAVVLTSGLGIAYLSIRSFEQLTDSFVVGMFPFYMLTVIAIPILRRKAPGLTRPFVVPLYPILPLVFLLGASALLLGAFLEAQAVSLWALFVMLLGYPLSFAFRGARLLPRRPT